MTLRNNTPERDPSSVRVVNELEDIVPEQLRSRLGLAPKLIELARGYGLNDMHDVTTEVLNMSKYTQLEQSPGQEVFVPQLNVDVNLANAPEILRMVSAGTLVSLALIFNDEFKVPWDVQYEGQGLFGETWANGYYHYKRAVGSENVYADMLEIYTDQLMTVQNWYIQQFGNIVDQLGKL